MKEYEILLEEGLYWMEESDYDSALDSFQRALNLTPKPELYNYIAYIYEETKEWELALENYIQAFKLGQEELSDRKDVGGWWLDVKTRPYLKALRGMADTYYQLGNYQEAIAHYCSLLNLNPRDHQEVGERLGESYLQGQKYTSAIDFYKILNLNSTSHFNLGLAFFLNNNSLQAGKEWKIAEKKNKFIFYLLISKKIPAPLNKIQYEHLDQELSWAQEYVNRFGIFWKEHHSALDFLTTLFSPPKSQPVSSSKSGTKTTPKTKTTAKKPGSTSSPAISRKNKAKKSSSKKSTSSSPKPKKTKKKKT